MTDNLDNTQTPNVPADPGKIQDHFELFHNDEYQELFDYKRQFEGAYSKEKIEEVAEWTKSWDYREKNFAREALTINPAKACQPLGALFVAAGFEDTLAL
jgi:nitrogenase molybdenum-iron protein beta chain